MFQILGLRKMNIANAESILDLNECDIQIPWQSLDNKDIS